MRRPNDDAVERDLARLREIFRVETNKHRAHERAAPILGDLANRPDVLRVALERHVTNKAGLCGGHYPVVAVMVDSNPWFDLVANCWLPLPDRDTDVSTKAIHHHGQMLLSTVTALGPGYEHWTFTTPELVDPARSIFSMRLLNRGPHGLYDVDFVDARIAHVPFYVASLTVTLALWSTSATTTWRDRAKRVPLLQRNANTLRRIATRAGLGSALELKNVEYFDFFPSADGFVGMRERQEFPRGPNGDYLQGLFHVVQQTGNEVLLSILEDAAGRQRIPDRQRFSQLVEELRGGREIDGRLSDGHFGVPFANFRSAEIERSLQASRS